MAQVPETAQQWRYNFERAVHEMELAQANYHVEGEKRTGIAIDGVREKLEGEVTRRAPSSASSPGRCKTRRAGKVWGMGTLATSEAIQLLTLAELDAYGAALDAACLLSPLQYVLLKHQNGTSVSTRYVLHRVTRLTGEFFDRVRYEVYAVRWDFRSGQMVAVDPRDAAAQTPLRAFVGSRLKLLQPFVGSTQGRLNDSLLLDVDRAALVWAHSEGALEGTDMGVAARLSRNDGLRGSPLGYRLRRPNR